MFKSLKTGSIVSYYKQANAITIGQTIIPLKAEALLDIRLILTVRFPIIFSHSSENIGNPSSRDILKINLLVLDLFNKPKTKPLNLMSA